MEFYEKLFQAIKNDDVKEFKDCMDTNYCGSLRLGRFPVLSVMYLYDSRRLLHAYEKKFLKHNSWQDVGEPMEIAAKFRGIAGKCLRLYLNETVSPLEMLLLLNRDYKLKQVFRTAHITAPVKQRLKDIYYIRWGLTADFVRGKIVLQRRPLTNREKWTWAVRAMCVVLCLAIVASTPFVANAISPFITDEQGVLNVSRWGQIDFNSGKIYALNKDVTVPSNFYVDEMNCELRGNGHTVTVEGNRLFGNLNGILEDITFATNGSPIVQTVTRTTETQYVDGQQVTQLKVKAENVTVNANVDMTTGAAIGFFANDNYCVISNVVVNVSGRLSIKVEHTDGEEVEAFNCGGIVANNNQSADVKGHYYGYLENCSVNYTDFVLQGNLEADAAFGGIVGTNYGIIESCQTNGAISANTFDVAGICADNNQRIFTCENTANISQTSDVVGWNPLAAGIVLNNRFVAHNCVNSGNISSVSTADYPTDTQGSPCAYATGIAYYNISQSSNNAAYVQYCVNNGEVSASALHIDANAAGLCNTSNGYVTASVNNGKISANGTRLVEAAGVVNFSVGQAYRSVNNGEISAISQEEVRVGGITSSYCNVVRYCFSFGSIEATGKVCYAGGLWGYSMNYSYEDSYGHKGLYCGLVMDCIADCDVNVTVTASPDSFAAVGGIVGVVGEDKSNGGTAETYIGGAIIGGYFLGTLQVSGKAYLGAMAGVVGERIYNATKSATDEIDKNFYDNFYVYGCGADGEFGVALDASGNYKTVGNVGALAGTRLAITSDKLYNTLMDDLKTILNGYSGE